MKTNEHSFNTEPIANNNHADTTEPTPDTPIVNNNSTNIDESALDRTLDDSSEPEEDEKDNEHPAPLRLSQKFPQPFDVPARVLRNRTQIRKSYQEVGDEQDSDSDKSDSEEDELTLTTAADPKALSNNERWSTTDIKMSNLQDIDTCKLAKRKKSINNTLAQDCFPVPGPKDKIAKFCTEKPIMWYLALKEFITNTNLTTRFELKRQKSNKVSIMRLYTVFQNSEILLSINFSSGICQIKGNRIAQWGEEIFPEIKAIFQGKTPSYVSPNLDGRPTDVDGEVKDDQVAEEVEKKREVRKSEDMILKDVTDKQGDLKTEISSIIADIKTLKTAIEAIEGGMLKLTSRIEELEKESIESKSDFKDNLSITEKKLDDKISTYQNVNDEFTKKELNKLRVDMTNKISGVRETVTNFKLSVETRLKKELDEISPNDESPQLLKAQETETEEKVARLEEIKEIKEIKNDLNRLDAEHETRFTDLNTLVKSVESGIKADYQEKFAALESRMKDVKNQVSQTNKIQAHARKDESSASGDQDTRSGKETTELIMCMDSNSKYLVRRKLWDLDGTEFRKCYTLSQVKNIITETVNYSKLKYFLISVGCNDLDTEDSTTVFNNIRGLVSQLTERYPQIKIIIGEITPRMDDKDPLVMATNALINDYSESSDKIFVIKNSNLRDPYFFYRGDSKHIRKACIGRFAANIKYTLRLAYGRKKYTPTQPGTPPVNRQHQHENQNQHRPQQEQLQQQQTISEQLQMQHLIHLLVQQQMNHQNLSNTSALNDIAHRFSDSRAVDIRSGIGVT